MTTLIMELPTTHADHLVLASESEMRALVFIAPGTTRITLSGLGNEILVTPDGQTVRSTQFTTYPVPEAHLAAVADKILDRVKRLGPGIRIAEVGVAVAGQVNADRTRITSAGSLTKTGWRGYPVAAELRTRLASVSVNPQTGPRVRLVNDAVARARWESLHHPVAAGSPFFALYWGVGIGLAMSNPPDISGTIRVTPYEFGHAELPARFAERRVPCDCGGYGHLEAWAGGGHLGNGLIGRARLSSQDLTSKSNRDRWTYVVQPVAAALAHLLAETPVPYVVLGGQRALEMHPHIRMLLPVLLTEELQRVASSIAPPDVVPSQLYLAPAFTAGTAFDARFAE